MSNVKKHGITIGRSLNDYVIDNTFNNDGVFIWEDYFSELCSHTIQNNTINGKKMYYYKNVTHLVVPQTPEKF